ncbi:MAG: response regulator [Alphaproteobacteria bacterium]|nr:response regulator [Alphaproteobacteria bacterium]
MAENRTVAVLTANAALSSILCMILADGGRFRVRQFSSPAALQAYMRIAPVHVAVCDFDLGETSCDVLAASIRTDRAIQCRNVQIIALTRRLDRARKQAIVRTGIDEVIIKPMSPAYVLERVRARLGQNVIYVRAPTGYEGPERRRAAAEPAPGNGGGAEIIPFARDRRETPSPAPVG